MMICSIKENGIIRKQNIEITEKMMGIYGYNNSGKTTILKEIDQAIDKKNWESIIKGDEFIRSLFIPTNRVIVKEAYTINKKIKDMEEFLTYKKESYNEFDLHLRLIRENLLINCAVMKIIKNALKYMFDDQYQFDLSKRQSDGVENIINIYCCIIWLLTWDQNIDEIELTQYLSNISAIVMIDEIEAFLHVYVQSRMLQKFKEDFPKCSFVFTTHAPLVLSRYQDIRKFHLEKGILNEINADMYYKDLDDIYEEYFDVNEFPEEAKQILNRLGDYIWGEEYSRECIVNDLLILQSKYINIRNKYPGLIAKVEIKLGAY